jgi:hypothetical protein
MHADPDRPKNDKATILGDSVQVVKELRSDVKRLKCEQTSLLDESRDVSESFHLLPIGEEIALLLWRLKLHYGCFLCMIYALAASVEMTFFAQRQGSVLSSCFVQLQQEKTELREEKAALKTETEQLQNQLQQRLRGMLPWMSMDPTAALMGAAPYPYPMPVPQPPPATPASTPPTSEPAPPVATSQPPVVGPSPFLSLAPPGVYMHPYAMYGARPPEGGHPYMPYPPYTAGSHSHVERPYAQYPSPISTMPGYLVQMQPPPQGGANTAAMYRPPPPYGVPGMTLVPPGQARGPHSTYPPHMHGPRVANSPEPQGVETSLQLQTPGGSSRSPASEPASQRSNQGSGESKTPEVGILLPISLTQLNREFCYRLVVLHSASFSVVSVQFGSCTRCADWFSCVGRMPLCLIK